MSKPTLYTFRLSVWSAAADLARIELGLADKIDAKSIDALHAENTSPEYIKINPAATLPALTADGKLYGDTTSTVDYMINVSSVKVAPRTDLTKAIHDDSLDPNFMFIAARHDEDVAKRAGGFPKILVSSRLPKIKEYAASAEGAPFKAQYDARIKPTENVLAIYEGTAPDSVKQPFFALSQANYDAAKKFVLETLPAAIGDGPFVGGVTPGEDDYHVACWLFHAGLCAGAAKEGDGIAALEAWFGAPVPEKVKALWSAWLPRESWKAVYPDGSLH